MALIDSVAEFAARVSALGLGTFAGKLKDLGISTLANLPPYGQEVDEQFPYPALARRALAVVG